MVPELTWNFWIVLGEGGLITRLKLRPYLMHGTQAANLRELEALSLTDYPAAPEFGVPAQFHLVDADGRRNPVAPIDVLLTRGPLTLFREAMSAVLKVAPQSMERTYPLMCVTPLLRDGRGKLIPSFRTLIRC
jgi:hypothetical protein